MKKPASKVSKAAMEDKGMSKAAAKKDDAMDKKKGIKENSKADAAMDKKMVAAKKGKK